MEVIEIHTNAWRWLTVEKSDHFGGRSYSINLTNDITDLLEWVTVHKKQLELEAEARKKFDSVNSAYEQYQTTLKLVNSE
jgi:hypothetical protein